MKLLNQKCLSICVLILFVTGLSAADMATDYFRGDRVVRNSIVVITEKTGIAKSTTNSLKTLASQIAGDVKSIIPERGLEEWTVTGNMEAALQRLNAVPGVSAFPNYIIELEPPGQKSKFAMSASTDPLFPYQWALHNNGAVEDSLKSIFGFSELESSVAGADIDMLRAWQAMEGKAIDTVLVVVFDTGIDYTHPDLQGNMWTNPNEIPDNGLDDDDNGFIDDYYGYDAYSNDSDPMDVYGHGTGVAGIIAAGIDTIGMSGIAPNVKLVAVKAGSDYGSMSTLSTLRGWYYVSVLQEQLIKSGSSTRIVALNQSWGGYLLLNEYNERLFEVTKNYALDHARLGIAWFCSAGNDYIELDEDLLYRYPSTIQVPNMMVIGATDYMENMVDIWWGSNHGMASVDVGAPGLQVLSTAPGGYQEFGGTSASTPHATGVFAIARGLNPSECYHDIFIRLMAGADRLSGYDGSWMTEARLNALNTIQPDSKGSSINYNVGKLLLLCAPIDAEAVGNAGFINGMNASLNVSAVTLSYTDGARESRSIDISEKGPIVEPNGAFGVAISIPLSEIMAGDNGYSRNGTIEFTGVGWLPFEVRLKQYPHISVSPEYSELPPVAWGETVTSEFTISNSGDIDLEFLLIPEIWHTNRYLDGVLSSVNQAPADMPQKTKTPRDFETVAKLDYQVLSKVLNKSDRPQISLNGVGPSPAPSTVLWTDSLNNAAEVANDWEIIDLGSGDNWKLADIDTSDAVDNVFLAGDFVNGYADLTWSCAASPYFNFRSIIETTKKIPVYLQFDYATELEEDHDFFYVNMNTTDSKIATIASTSRDLISVTDSARTVMIDISPYMQNLVIADSVTFWFIANMDSSNSAGFGVLFDNVSIWLGESPLVYEDASGAGVLDDVVPPGQDFPVTLTLNTRVFPEGRINIESWIQSNDPRNEWTSSDLKVYTRYGHISVTPEYCLGDSLYRGDSWKSGYSITNDGLVDVEYLILRPIDYQAPEPVLILGMPGMGKGSVPKSEPGIDHETRKDSFRSHLSQLKDRPVLQSIDQKAVSSIYKFTDEESKSEPWSWMETFDESMEIPDGWSIEDETYGLGSSWVIDSLQIDSVTATNVALFGDLTTFKYYNDSHTHLLSPWIPIPDSDTMRTILEFDYSTLMEYYDDWFDVYVYWREPGDESGETWRERPLATNDPDWDRVPLLASDSALHTFSTPLPFRVKGQEVMLMFCASSDYSVNTGYTLFDNVMLYQIPRNFYMTNRRGDLPVGETVDIDIAVKNTENLVPGDYSITSYILYAYDYDSLYIESFNDGSDIFLGFNLTELTILNHEPVIRADTLFAISGEIIGFDKILTRITRNDSDEDDSLRIVDLGEPLYGDFKDLLGIGMRGVAYVAPLLPETQDLLQDKFYYWSTDGWAIAGALVTMNVLQTPQFIRSAQHVFPINEDDSLSIDMMRLAAGLSITGVRLAWNAEPTVNLKSVEESSQITISPAPDFFGTTSAMLYLKRNTRTIDSTLVQFVVNSVNDLPVAALSMNVSGNTVSFTDESHDNRDKDGAIVARHWDFGDNLTSEEPNPVHVYADSGSYQVTLTVTDNAGALSSVEATVRIESSVGLADAAAAVPTNYRMLQNYPNPFNPTTTIHYEIPRDSHVRIDLFDLSGRLINSFVDQRQPAGYYSIHWDASNFSSGVYFYRMQADDPASGGAEGFSAVKKCILMK